MNVFFVMLLLSLGAGVLSAAPASVSFCSPVVSRYIPHIPLLPVVFAGNSKPTVSNQGEAHSVVPTESSATTLSVEARFGGADRLHAHLDADSGSRAGILELTGGYDLATIIEGLEKNAALRGVPYENPFFSEVGGEGWLNRSLRHSANADISYGQLTCALSRIFLQTAGAKGSSHTWAGRISVPFIRVDSRESYELVNEVHSLYSLTSTRDCIDRIRRRAHAQLGYTAGDWQAHRLGDITASCMYDYSRPYVWLFRSCGYAVELGIALPSGGRRDSAHPAAIPVGTNGHAAVSLQYTPHVELKESFELHIPCAFTWTFPKRVRERVSLYREAQAYSSFITPVTSAPGISFRCMPTLFWTSCFYNDKCRGSVSYVYSRQWVGRDGYMYDAERDGAVESFLTRAGATAFEGDVMRAARNVQTALAAWESSYIHLSLSYALSRGVAFATYSHPTSGLNSLRAYSMSCGVSFAF